MTEQCIYNDNVRARVWGADLVGGAGRHCIDFYISCIISSLILKKKNVQNKDINLKKCIMTESKILLILD